MDDISVLVSLWSDIAGLPPYIKTVAGTATAVLTVIARDRYHKKNVAFAISTAKAEQRAEDKADAREQLSLSRRIDSILGICYSRIYSGMQDFVYNHPEGSVRYITIVRAKHKAGRPAQEYLSEYQSAVKAVIFKVIKPFFEEQIAIHDVATKTQSTSVSEAICEEARELLLTEVHKRCGSNLDTQKVEDTVLTFEQMLDMYFEMCKACDLFRNRRNEEVKKEVEAVRS
jgi:hypothetical protein